MIKQSTRTDIQLNFLEPFRYHDYVCISISEFDIRLRNVRAEDAMINVPRDRGFAPNAELDTVGSLSDHSCAAWSVFKSRDKTDSDFPMPISSANTPPPSSDCGVRARVSEPRSQICR